MKTTKLYGITKHYHQYYLCLGSKCYTFNLFFGRKDKRFHTYLTKFSSETMLYNIMHYNDFMRFFGFIRVSENALRDMFNFM